MLDFLEAGGKMPKPGYLHPGVGRAGRGQAIPASGSYPHPSFLELPKPGYLHPRGVGQAAQATVSYPPTPSCLD